MRPPLESVYVALRARGIAVGVDHVAAMERLGETRCVENDDVLAVALAALVGRPPEEMRALVVGLGRRLCTQPEGEQLPTNEGGPVSRDRPKAPNLDETAVRWRPAWLFALLSFAVTAAIVFAFWTRAPTETHQVQPTSTGPPSVSTGKFRRLRIRLASRR